MSTVGPWIETVPWQSADGTLEAAYRWQAERLGEPAEFTMLGSLYPELVMERLRLYKVVEATPSALTPFERLIAAYVTSTLNHTLTARPASSTSSWTLRLPPTCWTRFVRPRRP